MLVFSIIIPSWPFSTIQHASISIFLRIMSTNIRPFSSLLEIRHPLNRIVPYLMGSKGLYYTGVDIDLRGLKVAASFSSSFLNFILDEICGWYIGASSLNNISFSRRFWVKGDPASRSKLFRFIECYSLGCWDFNSVSLKTTPDYLLNSNSVFLRRTDMQSSIKAEVPSVQLLNFDDRISIYSEKKAFFFERGDWETALSCSCLSAIRILESIIFAFLLNDTSD